MRYKHILAIDPSGAFEEGRGTTGWALFDANDDGLGEFIQTGYIDSGKFISASAFWTQHTKLIQEYHELYGNDLIVIIEDYLLYEHKAEAQINSKMETIRLIGILQYFCYTRRIQFAMQPANLVVNRWNNTVLLHKNIVVEGQRGALMLSNKRYILNRHVLDSMRHALHFAAFRNKEARR